MYPVAMVPRERLRDTVERLRDELASGEPLDAGERRELEQTLAEVSGLLDGEVEAGQQQGLVDALRRASERFESSHP